MKWEITKVRDDDCQDEIGITGPRGVTPGPVSKKDAAAKGGKVKKFRMRCGDDEIIYQGRAEVYPDDTEFEPLDDFGMPNYGCVSIEWYEKSKGQKNYRWYPL